MQLLWCALFSPCDDSVTATKACYQVTSTQLLPHQFMHSFDFKKSIFTMNCINLTLADLIPMAQEHYIVAIIRNRGSRKSRRRRRVRLDLSSWFAWFELLLVVVAVGESSDDSGQSFCFTDAVIRLAITVHCALQWTHFTVFSAKWVCTLTTTVKTYLIERNYQCYCIFSSLPIFVYALFGQRWPSLTPHQLLCNGFNL